MLADIAFPQLNCEHPGIPAAFPRRCRNPQASVCWLKFNFCWLKLCCQGFSILGCHLLPTTECHFTGTSWKDRSLGEPQPNTFYLGPPQASDPSSKNYWPPGHSPVLQTSFTTAERRLKSCKFPPGLVPGFPHQSHHKGNHVGHLFFLASVFKARFPGLDSHPSSP